MTLKELSSLYYLDKLIKRDEERLLTLQERVESMNAAISDMPRSPSPRNYMEESITEIVDVKCRLEDRKAEYQRVERQLENFIASIGDPQIELILVYRFIDMMKWNDVADKIGGNNTEDSVKKACYRFLKSTQKQQKMSQMSRKGVL